MRVQETTLVGAAANPDGIVASVTPGAGGPLTLLVTTLSPPRRVMITAAANETARTFTIVGVDRYGRPVTETLAGPNATTTLSTWEYQSLTSISVDAATTGAIEIGWNNVFYTQWFPLDHNRTPFNVSLAVHFFTAGMAANWTVQHTFQSDLLRNGPRGHNDVTDPIMNHDTLAAATAEGDGNYAFPIIATRLLINSIDDAAVIGFSVQQAGLVQ
jgi:hypothetical protein